MKKEKKVDIAKNISHGILGGAILALGIVMLSLLRDSYLDFVMRLVSLAVVAGSFAQAVIWLFQKKKKLITLAVELLCMALGVVMLFVPQIPKAIIPILFAAAMLLDGIVKTVDTVLTIKNHAPDLLFHLFPALFYLTFGVLILFAPLYHIHTVFIIVGIYCILLGGTYLLDFFHSLIPERTRATLRRRFRISLPIFLAAFVPHFVLEGLNHFLSEGGRKPDEYEDINEKKEEVTPDLEMFIHVANDRFVMTMGHCDINFEGELIAYGNYDDASATPIGTGDGVLLIDKKETYIPFCLEYNKTTIFSFGLKLTEEQKDGIRQRIREIKEQVYPWEPPYTRHRQENPQDAATREYKEFSNALCRADGAKFFKFHGGKWKTYFVMSTNCVLLADYIVCSAGTHILDPTGIISPGTFYDYLEAEFLRKGSMVVSRTVYSLDKNLKIKKEIPDAT